VHVGYQNIAAASIAGVSPRFTGVGGYTTFPRAVLRSACGSNREVP
jgi:hypothetical protein